jgi:hypothetical protein
MGNGSIRQFRLLDTLKIFVLNNFIYILLYALMRQDDVRSYSLVLTRCEIKRVKQLTIIGRSSGRL